MVDFANGISDAATGERLVRTLQGRGVFRRFKDQIYNHPELIASWQNMRETRARRRVVGWHLDQQLIDPEAGQQYFESHPDAQLP